MADTGITFDFSADALRDLERLRAASGVGNYGEVIRRALGTYRWVVEERGRGNEVGAIRDGQVVHVIKGGW